MARNFTGLSQGQFVQTLRTTGGGPIALAEDIRAGGIGNYDNDERNAINGLILDNNMIIYNTSTSQYEHYTGGTRNASTGVMTGGSWAAFNPSGFTLTQAGIEALVGDTNTLVTSGSYTLVTSANPTSDGQIRLLDSSDTSLTSTSNWADVRTIRVRGVDNKGKNILSRMINGSRVVMISSTGTYSATTSANVSSSGEVDTLAFTSTSRRHASNGTIGSGSIILLLKPSTSDIITGADVVNNSITVRQLNATDEATVGQVPVKHSSNTGDDTFEWVDRIQDDDVGIDELSATGTPSSSTYLRGDNTWAPVNVTDIFNGQYTISSSTPDANGEIQFLDGSAVADEFDNWSTVDSIVIQGLNTAHQNALSSMVTGDRFEIYRSVGTGHFVGQLSANASTTGSVTTLSFTGTGDVVSTNGVIGNTAVNVRFSTGDASIVFGIDIAPGTIDSDQIADDAINVNKIDISNTPTNGQVLSWDNTNGFTWATDQTGSTAFDIQEDVTTRVNVS